MEKQFSYHKTSGAPLNEAWVSGLIPLVTPGPAVSTASPGVHNLNRKLTSSLRFSQNKISTTKGTINP